MERALSVAPIAQVRAVIAHEWLRDPLAPERVGSIVLRPHQREAVQRIRAVMARAGGALLADDVGLGKTYVAAAVAREHAHAVIVCPATLREMWRRALSDTAVKARIVTYSELSRGRVPTPPVALLVLDEAHHARTPGTRRYAELARLAAGARVLALSATPIHNSRADLAAVLALFLGARAWAMSDAELATCIVRREADDLVAVELPALAPPQWVTVGDDECLLHAIMELPPPVPPLGGGDGGALVSFGLARQWASSRAALEGALRRRLARAAALGAALEDGHYPTARELSAWSAADDAIQLAFPSLVSASHAGAEALLAALRDHARGLAALLSTVRADTQVDERRAARLRELRLAHAGERIVAFSQYADTVHALFRRLAPGGGVAALSARGARVAGGAIPRTEAIARFEPRASRAERVDLLLATDLLSEGIDLGHASVVVHLDLPWTPARMEQRVGRSRRMGAAHARTTVYALAPPAAAESLLAIERRLREKAGAAGRVTGVAGAILPSLGPAAASGPGAARTVELLRRVIASWRDEPSAICDARPLVALARGPRSARILLARADGACILAGAVDADALSADPSAALAAAEIASLALPVAASDRDAERALAAAESFLVHRRAAAAAGGISLFRANARRTALRRIAAIAGRVPHHRRALVAPLAATARRVVTTPFGLGAEQVLEALAGAPLADEAWLRALSEFGAIHAPESAASLGGSAPPGIIALVVVASDS